MYPYRINVLDRAFHILDCIAASQQECGLIDISQVLKIPKSSIHRFLMVLESHRYVERNPATGRYRLGSKLFELQSSAAAKIDVARVSYPFLERLVAATGETAHLGVLRDGEVVSLCNAQSPHTLRPSTVGRRVPAYCTSLGKAMLAYMPKEELEAYLRGRRLDRRTAHTICRIEKLKAELQRTCERGYAIDDEEFEEGLKCVGAPVRDHTGRVIAALSVAGPRSRMERGNTKGIAESVTKSAVALSAALGYRASDRAT